MTLNLTGESLPIYEPLAKIDLSSSGRRLSDVEIAIQLGQKIEDHPLDETSRRSPAEITALVASAIKEQEAVGINTPTRPIEASRENPWSRRSPAEIAALLANQVQAA